MHIQEKNNKQTVRMHVSLNSLPKTIICRFDLKYLHFAYYEKYDPVDMKACSIRRLAVNPK